MSHAQQVDFFKGLIGNISGVSRFSRKAILEMGSFNVNGAVRDLFFCPREPAIPPARYVGVDWRGGPGVDHICLFHDMPWTEEFDVLVSCNAFEHDPYWKKSIEAGLRALRAGGEIIFMAAGTGYPAHEVNSSPSDGHYKNIEPQEFCDHLTACGAVGVMTVFTDPPDVAFHGIKRAS